MLIAKQDFARLLSHVTKAVESRNTIPILSHVRLIAAGGRLTATATDLDVQVTANAACEGDISICIDAKLLGDIVKKAGGDTIDLDHSDGKVVLKSGRSRFTLQTLPVGDFPDFSVGEMPVQFEADLAAMFAPVKFAISTEETRYYLNGVFLEPGTATATDGHRLGTHDVATGADFSSMGQSGVIVPRKMVDLLPSGLVAVSLSATKICVETADVTIVSKLIDGTFPDYRRVIPTGNDKLVVFDRDEMMRAADRVATVSDQRGRAVRLSITPGQVELAVRGDAEATDVVQTEYSGEPVDIGFNARYLVDVLGQLPSGPVTMALEHGGSPALFTGGKEGLRLVCMPMRVS